MRISNAAAIVSVDNLLDLLDVGGTGKLEFRTGTIPPTVETTATGTLLGTIDLSATSFGGAVDGTDKATATMNGLPLEDASADNTGTIGYARAYDGANLPVIDFTVTVTAGGGDIEVDTLSVVALDTIRITAFTISQPET
jgi:hypothetical protein